MKAGWVAAWSIGFGILLTLLAVGIILLVSSQPRGEPIRLQPAPSDSPLVVQVGGEVANPGVYHLPPGSRVLDAIQAAGGALPQANIQSLNQAELIQDGELIWIPAIQPTFAPLPSNAVVEPGSRSQPLPSATPGFPINLNTAGPDELQALPEIGPKLAQRIIDYRLANGPFTSIEDIQAVDGIGPGIFEQIKDLITVEVLP